MKILTRFLLLCLLLLGPASAFGQKRTCRILFFNPPRDAPKTLHLFDGSDSKEVELPKMNFSAVHDLPSGRLKLVFLANPPVDAKHIPAGAPSAIVSETMRDIYLIVTSDPKNMVAPVRMQVIDAGVDKLKAGQMLWLNLTPNTIGGDVGIQRLVAKPNSRQVLDPPAREAGGYPIQLFFQLPGSKDMHPLCSTSWGHDPRSRNIVFINMEPGSRTPRVRGFKDFRVPRGQER